MQYFEIEGGHTLSGEITPQGAKNEALQILCAILLTPEKVKISNVPNILDVNRLIECLEAIGVEVEKSGPHEYTFCARNVEPEAMLSDSFRAKAARLRGSFMMLGPMLARFGEGFMPRPGGDKIGRRRVDTHFLGFEYLGAEFEFNHEDNFFRVYSKGRLKGTQMTLDEPSVTGTANIIMAAVLAEGTTQIYYAACEPYIQQLCKMLNRMGAKIRGIGSNLLIIEGVEALGGTEHRMLADMIEVGSFIGMAAMTQSKLTIKNADVDMLGQIPGAFKRLGVKLEYKGDDVIVHQQDVCQIQSYLDGSIMTIYDNPWPGLTPDILSVLLVTAIQCQGTVLIHQKMFESRLFFVDKLIDMGGQIILCDPHRATVVGHARNTQLRGITMSSPDIRAGVALLIAALSASGTSRIYNIEQIDRGYQNIEERLQKLGAKIRRLEQ
ncbi:MAG: UDP-N-acetylglucosamine 1-carboxyvinyltransferase [Bacteroidia bacterium]|nr:UDP-N-acetylglucosamine 1-carboxyvinyltransferase [Bacteroidia bacterium]